MQSIPLAIAIGLILGLAALGAIMIGLGASARLQGHNSGICQQALQ